MNRRVTALIVIALAVSGLPACAASSGGGAGDGSSPGVSAGSDAPGDDGQSVADACALVRDTIAAATEEFDSAAEDDPAAVVDAMRSAADELATIAEDVTNDEVSAVLPGIRDMYVQTADLMQAVADGDQATLEESGEIGDTMQESMQQYQQLCLVP